MEKLEDTRLADKARKVLKRIESGEEKAIPWDKIKKRLIRSPISNKSRRKRSKIS
ncbi:MAG: hypothetical protein JSR58_02205 [Verrucomicrobia bacterium]|nr:hypothetical protein [Verrucomicrobiota bacterium]